MCNIAVCERITQAISPVNFRRQGPVGRPARSPACAHKLARIVYNMMRYGVEYAKRSEAEYAGEQRTRLEKSLQRRAKEMGYELMKSDGEVVSTPEPMFLNA